jgi:hypothetical protein
MSGIAPTFVTNARWEVRRLYRSQRIFLFLIPPIAGPIGSAIADLYLHIPSLDTALILGLLITGGLGALVILDLTALAVGEELTLRAHLAFFPLPQRRGIALAGRLLVVVGGPCGAYAIGAAGVWALGGALVTTTSTVPPIFIPFHLLLSIFALLLGLAGVAAAAAVVTRTASEALVAGVLAGVVLAGGAGYFVFEHTISAGFPIAVALVGAGGLGWTLVRYPTLEG